MSRIELSDGSSWPRPCMGGDDRSVTWAARYSTLTREELMQLVALADAYGYLVCETTQKRRDQVIKEMRQALRDEVTE